MNIDLVYTWVDIKDNNFLQEKLKYENSLKPQDFIRVANKSRFTDNDELKYSLRSVNMYAPWINKIYIITNGQVPKWLNTNYSKIKIVNHKDIMPQDSLPTFNSGAIETCLAEIKDLSEYFIYSNDDFFLNKPVKPELFFNEKGYPIANFIVQHWDKEKYLESVHCHNVVYSSNLIYKKFGIKYNFELYHNMSPYRKSYFLECKNEFKEDFTRTTCAKFRERDCVLPIIVNLYGLVKNKLEFKIRKNKSRYFKLYSCFIELSYVREMKKILKRNSPTLFCINDNNKAKDIYRKKLGAFLNSLFPNPAPWEKEEYITINHYNKDEPKKKYIKYFWHYSFIYIKYKFYKVLFQISLGKIKKYSQKRYEYLKEKIKTIKAL